jgi:hypothetical protein
MAQQPEMTFDKAPVANDTPVPSAAPAMTFDASPVDQDTEIANGLTPTEQAMAADKSIGPEEKAFLKGNPSYQYLPADKRFPNRQPGIYPRDKWRSDPSSPMASNSQFPVDLHLVKHTLQGAATGAIPAAAAVALPAAMAATAPTVTTEALDTGLVDQYGEPIVRAIEKEGPTLLKQGAKAVTDFASKHKIGTGAVGLWALKKMGIDPLSVLKELL